MKPSIYIASKTKYANRWRCLREDGANIIATWIDEAGPGETEDHADLAMRCIREPATADVTILYIGMRDEIAKGSLIEVGAALAAGKRVIQVGECVNSVSVFQSHPLWSRAQTMGEAIVMAKREPTP